jgi:hypothetical protein
LVQLTLGGEWATIDRGGKLAANGVAEW